MKAFSRRHVIIGAGLAAAAVYLPAIARADTTAPPQFTVQDLGPIPLESLPTYAQDYRQLPEGPRGVFVVNGTPIRVVLFNPFTLEIEWDIALPGSSGGSWAVKIGVDGTVYVGTWGAGQLWRKRPTDAEFVLMGRPDRVSYIWAMDVDDQDNVYLGTFLSSTEDGHLFSWNERDGFRDYGVPVPGAAYVRGIAHHEGTVYAGTFPVNDIVAVDVATGEMQSLPPFKRPMRENQGLRVTDGVLWAHVSGAATIAFDIESQTWLPVDVPGFGRGLSNTGPDGRVYTDSYTLMAIVAVDPVTGEYESVGTKPGGETFAIEWLTSDDGERRLFCMQASGQLLSYAIGEDGLTVQNLPNVPGQLADPAQIAEGPSGEIWASSMMIRNYVPFDVTSDEWGDQIMAMGQGDSMIAIGDDLWVGSYSGAQIFRYRISDPVEEGVNPELVFALSTVDQDRVANMQVADGRLLVGTIPGYGKNGGALAIHDLATGETSTFRNVIQDHSVVGVMGHEGRVFVGTSVHGGLGIDPPPGDGVLAEVDPSTGEVLRQVVPVPGQKGVREIVVGPDGGLWGLAGGELFRADLETLAVEIKASVNPVNWDGIVSYWTAGSLEVNPITGQLTGVAGFNRDMVVFTYDIDDGRLEILATGARHEFAQHSSGDLYWLEGNHLMRGQLDRPSAPETDPNHPGHGRGRHNPHRPGSGNPGKGNPGKPGSGKG
uniref:hypothetical protein n=1 Tax=Tessaracoccus timonensis TaxID=2161816 RepID=UPI000D54BEBD|nr:hypothetical protein [Tessaracoccus timonensis]